MQGEEWPLGSGVFHTRFSEGPKLTGGLQPGAATPVLLGPRN